MLLSYAGPSVWHFTGSRHFCLLTLFLCAFACVFVCFCVHMHFLVGQINIYVWADPWQWSCLIAHVLVGPLICHQLTDFCYLQIQISERGEIIIHEVIKVIFPRSTWRINAKIICISPFKNDDTLLQNGLHYVLDAVIIYFRLQFLFFANWDWTFCGNEGKGGATQWGLTRLRCHRPAICFQAINSE